MIKITLEKLKELSEEFGDSYYILDTDVFRENCENLLASFKKFYNKFNIAYSYKTNYIPVLGRIVDDIGGFAEVVSAMELETALRIGVSPERIIWNGPVKPKEEMESFLLSGGTVNIDNIQELYTIRDIAECHYNRGISIGVRCNYEIGDGVVSRFGIDVGSKEFDKVFCVIASTENLLLRNLQAHFAKRYYKYWPARVKGLLSVYEKVVSDYKLKPEWLDLGGGLSGNMPDSLREQMGLDKFSFDDYASGSARIFSEYFKEKTDQPWLFLEPGTAVAADCMRYVCRVEHIKQIRGKTIITTNGSQKNINMNGINPPLEVVHCGKETFMCRDADIAGYTCIESDYLYKGYTGEVSCGDYLIIGSCGSYSIVMKPPFIMPNIPVIDISKGNPVIIKRAETFDDVFGSYIFA